MVSLMYCDSVYCARPVNRIEFEGLIVFGQLCCVLAPRHTLGRGIEFSLSTGHMAYKRNFRAAAKRHLGDGNYLLADGRHSNAGYHFGLAAECALKGAFVALGHTDILKEGDGKKTYYAHFPALKSAPATLTGRLSARIAAMLVKGSFMHEWDIKMRYSSDGAVDKKRCVRWREDVELFLGYCAEV